MPTLIEQAIALKVDRRVIMIVLDHVQLGKEGLRRVHCPSLTWSCKSRNTYLPSPSFKGIKER